MRCCRHYFQYRRKTRQCAVQCRFCWVSAVFAPIPMAVLGRPVPARSLNNRQERKLPAERLFWKSVPQRHRWTHKWYRVSKGSAWRCRGNCCSCPGYRPPVFLRCRYSGHRRGSRKYCCSRHRKPDRPHTQGRRRTSRRLLWRPAPCHRSWSSRPDE
ncbi:hypothetical protein D3C80_1720990 [compost metagenome]